MLRRTRRAPTACLWCHHRKVRCDASILGCPCTRCRQDGRPDCTLRRNLTKRSTYSASHDRSPSDLADMVAEQRDPRNTTENRGHMYRSPHSTESLDETDQGQAFQTSAWCTLADCPFLLPDDLTALAHEDLAFLRSKGSLSIPNRVYTREFVTQYFRRIHPILPVLDETLIWRAFEGGTTQKVSLFAFQALLFASCPFVSLQTLQRCGFADKRDARKKLYIRSQVLYELMVETRPFARAQGALLLTHHTSAEAPQAGSLWLARAIENAMLLDTEPTLIVENVSKSMKKRLWWSILLRDRSLCIGLRRQPQIASHNLHSCREWLYEHDFAGEMFSSPVFDYETKQRLLAALQDQCRLAVLLTDLVSLVFTPRVTTADSYSEDTFRKLMCTIEDIKKPLIAWERKAQAPDTPNDLAGDPDPSLTTRNLTFMYYHAARVDLAQFAALAVEEHPALTADLYRDAVFGIGHDLSAGIKGLTRVMEYFSRYGHVQYLPLSVLGYVGMPLILAAIDLKLSPSSKETRVRQKRLDSLSKIIRLSESLYDVTDFVAAGTNHILQLAYMTTQNFFLPSSLPSRIINTRVDRDLTRQGKGTKIQDSIDLRPAGAFRAKNWLEAFLRCPRAYLLISTSVDYSLAVGRLPYKTSLPALVRDLPAMGAMTRLPWNIHTDLNGGIPLYGRVEKLESSPENRREPVELDTAASAEDSYGGRDIIRKTPVPQCGQEMNDGHERMEIIAQAPPDTNLRALERPFESAARAVNLDFLDLEANSETLDAISCGSAAQSYAFTNPLKVDPVSGVGNVPGQLIQEVTDSVPIEGLIVGDFDSILLDPLCHEPLDCGHF